MTYSLDFREAVLTFRKKGHTIKQTCETFNIPKKTYHNWTNLQQQTDSLQPKKTPTRKRKIDKQKLRQYIEEHPDAYLKELAQHFNVKTSSIHNALVKLKITRKKKFHIQ
ncbi:MAG: transposase [Nitrososphaerota archaeon]|jgi:transposase|nr:transposase [Nitrososphaerota archaeon]